MRAGVGKFGLALADSPCRIGLSVVLGYQLRLVVHVAPCLGPAHVVQNDGTASLQQAPALDKLQLVETLYQL